jgi:DNA-3-methyladenine glycosylase
VRRTLSRAFFARDTLSVARELLGKVLAVGPRAVRIVETEAYFGTDPASHSRRGPTPRCAIMFGPPRVAYVYFCYGMHHMLNFVTEPAGRAGAVLIRAAAPASGVLAPANGPGRLCKALGITLAHNGLSLAGPRLKVLDDGFTPAAVRRSRRVGIRVGVDKPWRFFVAGDPHVSPCPQNKESKPCRN